MRKWSTTVAMLAGGLSLLVGGEQLPTPIAQLAAAAPAVRLAQTNPSAPPVPQVASHIAFGLYNPGVPDDMPTVSAAEAAIGKPAAILMWYKHWGGAWNNFYPQGVNAVASHGSVPMITWMSDDYTIAELHAIATRASRQGSSAFPQPGLGSRLRAARDAATLHAHR